MSYRNLTLSNVCLFQGFMTREERKKFESLHSPYNKYWIPCVWFTNLAAVARCEGRIKDDNTYKLLLEVTTFKRSLKVLHDSIYKSKIVNLIKKRFDA